MRKNKKITTLLILAMMMTMLAGIGTANAAGVTYRSLAAPIISTDGSTFQQLGKVRIDIDDVRSLSAEGEWLTIALPAGCTYDGVTGSDASQAGLEIDYTNLVEVSSQKTAKDWVELKIKADPLAAQEGKEGNIFLDFKSIQVRSGSGDIKVSFSGPGIFSQLKDVSIASTGAKAGIDVQAGTVKNIGDMGGYIDSITVSETRGGILKEGDTITLRLPAGFSWGSSANIVAVGGWAFEGFHGMGRDRKRHV